MFGRRGLLDRRTRVGDAADAKLEVGCGLVVEVGPISGDAVLTWVKVLHATHTRGVDLGVLLATQLNDDDRHQRKNKEHPNPKEECQLNTRQGCTR
jgi:hypothetical protein